MLRRVPAQIRALDRRQWLAIVAGSAMLVGIVAGIVVFTGGDSASKMSRDQFVSEFKRVTDTPPDDALIACLFDKMAGDTTLQSEALKATASPQSATRLQQIAQECRLNQMGRTGGAATPPSSSPSASQPPDSASQPPASAPATSSPADNGTVAPTPTVPSPKPTFRIGPDGLPLPPPVNN